MQCTHTNVRHTIIRTIQEVALTHIYASPLAFGNTAELLSSFPNVNPIPLRHAYIPISPYPNQLAEAHHRAWNDLKPDSLAVRGVEHSDQDGGRF
jgi:hypothetical protein